MNDPFVATLALYTVYVFLPIFVAIFCAPCRNMLPYIVYPFSCLASCGLTAASIAMIVFAIKGLIVIYKD